jgi:3,4-dihydroxy 2-butanone 4-phosphate synthase
LEEVKERLLNGHPVFIYDFRGREEEVDMVYYAPKVSAASIYMLRKLGGGLICFAMPYEVGVLLGLDFMTNLLKESSLKPLVKRPKYGDYPAFSIWVNHVDVKTGISDEDRALTVRKLYEVAHEALSDPLGARRRFAEEFYAPGHVPVLLARKLNERKGHTELSVRLAERLGIEPFVVFAEVLDYGRSMSLEKAKEIAKALGAPLLKGEEIVRFVGMTSDSNVER